MKQIYHPSIVFPICIKFYHRHIVHRIILLLGGLSCESLLACIHVAARSSTFFRIRVSEKKECRWRVFHHRRRGQNTNTAGAYMSPSKQEKKFKKEYSQDLIKIALGDLGTAKILLANFTDENIRIENIFFLHSSPWKSP